VAFLILPASALILVSGCLLAARLPLRGALERLSAAMLLSLAGMTVVLLFAGVGLQTLNPLAVLLLSAAGTGLVIALTGAFHAGVWHEHAAGARRSVLRIMRIVRSHPSLALLGIVVVGAIAWRAILAVRIPVLEYDGLSYHVVTVDVWLQTDHIGRVPQRIWSDGYPANGELLTLWLMLFSTSDTLARLTNLLVVPLAGVSTAGVAVALGARPRWALLAGLLVMALPVVLVRADSTYVDNVVMAYIAAAWCFGIRAIRETAGLRRRALYLLAGVALGLGLGTKLSSAYALVFLGGALAVASLVRIRAAGWRSAVLEGAAVAVPTFALGSYWYLKNLAVHGNPVWPFNLGSLPGKGSVEELIVQHPPGLEGVPQWAQISMSWMADVGARSYPMDIRLGGYGLVWPLLLVLGAAGLFVLLRRRQFAPIATLCIPTLIALWLTPMAWSLRYTLLVPVLVAALAAVALTVAPRFNRTVGWLLVGLSIASVVVAHRTGNFAIGTGSSRPGIVQLARFVLSGEERRRDVGLWRECAGFGAMPADAKVRTDGFNLLHLIAGPGADRQLLIPFGSDVEPRSAITMDGATASYMALVNATHIAAARADPGHFVALGPVCRGVELFAVRPS
jgi:hypothetical protein